jgi:glycosyltransferase involved in cell wall biosynthesis
VSQGPFISVVTPVYNTGAYLAEAVRSVLAQTRADFELIIIDNHSTDDSPAIAARFAEEDARVRVVKPPRFLKQDENYNFAVEQISHNSEFCKVVQADDWLFPRCLEEQVDVALRDPQIAIVGSYRLVGNQPDGFGLSTERSVFTGREACRAHLLDAVYPFGSPTTVMFRSELVRARRPFFPLGVLHFDTELVFELLREKMFGFAHQILSYSRRQPESISGSTESFNPHVLDHIIIIEKFGEHYLTPGEYSELLGRELQEFYRGLARQWLKERVGARSDAFWQYQERGLAMIGERIDASLLARSVAALVAEKVLPGAGVDLVRRVSARAFKPAPT